MPDSSRRRFHFCSSNWRTCAFAALTAAASPLLAQDAIVIGGSVRYDTRAYDLPIDSVSVSDSMCLVLRNDGRVFLLGASQLPEPPLPPPGTGYTKLVAISSYYAGSGFGLLDDGTILDWQPSGAAGQPAPPLPPNITYVDVSAGYDHVVALRSDGVAVAWGAQQYGQTALPTLPPGVTVMQVAAGVQATLLRLSNGNIVAAGTGSISAVPALPPGLTYTALWAGSSHAIARRSDAAWISWGNNSQGQGNLPALPPGVDFTDFALGSGFTVGLRSDGVLVTWGNNYNGELDPPTLPPGMQVAQLGAANSLVALRSTNGELITWGRNNYVRRPPQLQPGERWRACNSGAGAFGLTSTGRVLPVGIVDDVPALPVGLRYEQLFGSRQHMVALRSDGRAVAWGANSWGQCAIPPLPPGMTYLGGDASWSRTMLLRSDGQIVQTGSNPVSLPPLPVGLVYREVSSHDQGTLLRRSDDLVLAIGNSAPPTLPAGVRYVSIAQGRYYRAALRSDGQIEIWGTTLGAPLPPLPSGVVYVQVSLEEDHVVARRSDGEVVAGASYNNDVGLPRLRPGESFVDVATGYDITVLRLGPTCSYITYAPGCAGTLPASRLVPRDTPRLGQTLAVTVFDVPFDLAMMVFGWQRTAPTSLANFGMPGCLQHVSVDAGLLLVGSQQQARSLLPIPDAAALVGLRFVNQAIVFDPLANPAGAVVSNAAEGVIGF